MFSQTDVRDGVLGRAIAAPPSLSGVKVLLTADRPSHRWLGTAGGWLLNLVCRYRRMWVYDPDRGPKPRSSRQKRGWLKTPN